MTNIPEETSVVEAQPKVVVAEQPAPTNQISGFCITSLVLGIVSIFVYAFALGILSVTFGGIGLSKAPKAGLGGKGLAKAGLVLGIISIAWTLLKLVL